MKSERRHDLETNDLAIRMKDAIETSKPYLFQLLVGVAVVALLFAFWGFWGRSSSVTEQQAWDKFMLASYSSDPEMLEMKRLAENSEYSGTSVPEWAYLMWCDRQLQIASQTYLVDREATTSRLKQIQGIFEGLTSSASVPQIRDRARYGLAQVYEMQAKVDEAEAKYSEVKGDLSSLASGRAEQLELKEVKEACNWLASAELPKRKAASTNTSGSGSRPSFEAEVPGSVAAPSAIQDSRSLEEILTGSAGTGSDEDRYQETDSENDNETVGDAPAEEPSDADSEESDEKPADGQ
ncbi:YfgM family protein [Bythopirellula goksoeyrii]|uniref:Tetratricopeptide repeat-like domain-containing protein n=1 Tax=Bythopirellula goksoeyrii TaxID=1400387 RepID=A0A5B9QCG0_9BACT|nr:hypothetical protein [Bythopirellula goksoeyrii]QEG35285.1 hypothetical protein Pr1d_25810 [Bythopirellula goksoeyrii]